jgi:trehalose 6-phosphate phosphatase
MVPVPREHLLGLARGALMQTPAGLVTDFDGTLAPIVSDPRAAEPTASAVPALNRLAERLAVVAVITGRAALDARRLLGGPARIWIVGNHGLEWLPPGSDEPEPTPNALALQAALSKAGTRVPVLDGVTIEEKGLSATIHYRLARDPKAARSAILDALAGAEHDLEVREGRQSVELRPRGAGDKGSALRSIVERFGLRGLLVAGDDLTDLDMFRAAHELGGRGLRSVVFAIAGSDEVPSSVSGAADATLADPAAFADLLQALADEEPGEVRR